MELCVHLLGNKSMKLTSRTTSATIPQIRYIVMKYWLEVCCLLLFIVFNTSVGIFVPCILLQSSEGNRSSMYVNDTPRGSWASSIFDLRNSQADSLLPSLLEHTAQEALDQQAQEQRQMNRQEALFSLYQQQHEVEHPEF